jgi:hypothetical protein
MKMKNPYLHKQSFNRTNLQYTIRKKDASLKLIKDIAQIVQDRKTQTGIIYCLSKKDTESVCELLQLGIYVSICLCIYLSMYLFVYVSICICTSFAICLFVYESHYLSVYLSILTLYIYLSIYLSIY